MRTFFALTILGASACCALAQQINQNAIFSAMEAEQQRSIRELYIGELARPYNIEYILQIRHAASVHSVLGTVERIDSGVQAFLTVRVRVGSPTFDNTNFFDVSLGFFGSSDDEEGFKNRRVPFELTESNLRRELWLATDACFKQAVETYAKKEATLKNRTRSDTTWDFSFIPGESIESLTPSRVEPDVTSMRNTTERLSSIFNQYPLIQNSRVGIEVVPEETFYLNTEGRRVHKMESFVGIEVIATTQANDGMPLAQTYAAYGITPTDLPTADSLERAVHHVAEVLSQQVSAPIIEPYSGPVLFEGHAAAGILGQFFAPNLVAQRALLSEGGFSTNERNQAFQNKIGARVLPEFLTVRAVPTRRRDNGRVLGGYYEIDDEGIHAQDVLLVDNGYLRSLLSSRVPTKRIKVSNGHQRGGGAMFSTIEVSCTDAKYKLTSQGLKKRLLKLIKDRELPYGIVVRATMDQNLLFTGVFKQLGSDLPISQGEGKIGLLRAYRVYADGREELIRGVEGAGIAPASFKDIVAVSKSTTVHNFLAPSVIPSFISGGSAYLLSSIITPDLLFEDIEVRPLDGDMPKPPTLSNPIAGE